MNDIEERDAPRRNPLLWPIRFILHWSIKLVVLVFMGIRAVLTPRPVRFGIVALLLLGVVGWNFAGPAVFGKSLTAPAAAPTPAPTPEAQYTAASTPNKPSAVSVQTSVKLEPSPVVEQYLKAQSNYDANGMWDTISDELKQQLAQSNTSLTDLQSELDAAKQSGRQYLQAMYVGGVPLDASDNAYFYVLTVATSGGTQHVPYTYVVGSDGKIVSIQ